MDGGARKKRFSSHFIPQSDAIAWETQHLEKMERKGKFLRLIFVQKGVKQVLSICIEIQENTLP